MKNVPAYSFSELSVLQQQHVREEVRNALASDIDLSDEFDHYKTELEELGFYEVNIDYSSGGPGEGASWTGKISVYDAKDIIDIEPCSDDDDKPPLIFQRTRNLYAHAYTVRIIDEEQLEQPEFEKLNEWRINYCREMFQAIQSYEESLYSNEAVTDWIEHNDPYFVIAASGKPVYIFCNCCKW